MAITRLYIDKIVFYFNFTSPHDHYNGYSAKIIDIDRERQEVKLDFWDGTERVAYFIECFDEEVDLEYFSQPDEMEI